MGIFNKKTTSDDSQKPVKKTGQKPAKVSTSQTDDNATMKDLYGQGEASSKPAEAVAGSEKKTKTPQRAYRVLVKPLITEKATNLGSENKYLFEVAVDANKIEVAKAVKEVYGIKPTAVNMIKRQGKKSTYRRIEGQRKSWKKAIVTLPKGKTINIYEGI